MSDVLILGDLHIGCKKGSKSFLMYQKRFFDNLFDVCSTGEIEAVIQLGDVLDNRQRLDFMVNQFLKSYFFHKIEEIGVPWYILLGNHDIYLRQSLDISGTKQIAADYPHVHVIDSCTDLELHERTFKIIPWVCDANKDEVLKFLESKDSEAIVVGHFELANFQMYQGHVSQSGTLSREVLQGFHEVFSGHYHTPSTDGYIHYIGTPYQLTWADYGDKKKFIRFNLDTGAWKEVFTNNQLYFKINFEDLDIQSIKANGLDMPELSRGYIKIYINDTKTKDKDVSLLLNLIEEQYNPHSLNVIDNTLQQEIKAELDEEDFDDPFSALLKTINAYCGDNNNLKSDMLEYAGMFYKKALEEQE